MGMDQISVRNPAAGRAPSVSPRAGASTTTPTATEGPAAAGAPAVRDSIPDPIMTAHRVDVYYGDKHAVKNVSLDIGRNQVLAMIGPSGCGKSTVLRCLNRMNHTVPSARRQGE